MPVGRLVDRRAARATTVGGIALMGGAAAHSTVIDLAGPPAGAVARFGLSGATNTFGQVLRPIVADGVAEVLIPAELTAPDDLFGTAPIFMRAGALWASMVVLTASDVLAVYPPAIDAERGWSVAFVSILPAVRASLSFAVRVCTAPLVRLFAQRTLVVGACGIGAVALLLMVPGLPAWVAIVLMAITGFVLGIGQPLTMAWVARSAPDELRATALAVRLTADGVGQSLDPVAVGAVAALAGSGAIFIVLSALLVSTSVAVARSNLR